MDLTVLHTRDGGASGQPGGHGRRLFPRWADGLTYRCPVSPSLLSWLCLDSKPVVCMNQGAGSQWMAGEAGRSWRQGTGSDPDLCGLKPGPASRSPGTLSAQMIDVLTRLAQDLLREVGD